MRNRITRFFAAAAASTAIILGLAASPALAGLNPHITQVRNGEAGYYVNDNGGWRIRDAHSTVIVTSAMRDLNGTTEGAVGNELCDPNVSSTFAAQLGLIWNPRSHVFEVHYATGPLTAPVNDANPCIDRGLINPDPEGTPQLLQGVNIHAGDVLTFDVYYNPAPGAEYIQFTASDVTQNVTRQVAYQVGWQSFYEAGIGVLSNNLPALTPPAVNIVAPFTDASFNNYTATTGHNSVLGGWETKQAETVNGGAQVILSPDSSLAPGGNAFKVFEGGII